MKRAMKDVGGVFAAFVAWWSVAVLLGMLFFAIWPPGHSFTAGLSLEPQNVPGNVLGFILALYAFRKVTESRTQDKVTQSRENAENAV